jgi:hypothetical protein
MTKIDTNPQQLKLIAESGSGRSFIIIYEENDHSDLAGALFEALQKTSRALLIAAPRIDDNNWQSLTKLLLDLLEIKGIRQASFVSFSDASALVMNISLQDLKLVRTLVLVDAATRPHPSLFSRMIDRLERFLPLGLPMRSYSKGFDAKSFLQRIRCPVLVVTTQRASLFILKEAEILMSSLPSAWYCKLDTIDEVGQLNIQVMEFQKVPAKCPQKNMRAA